MMDSVTLSMVVNLLGASLFSPNCRKCRYINIEGRDGLELEDTIEIYADSKNLNLLP